MNDTLPVTGLASDQEIIGKILGGEITLFEVLIRRTNPVLYKLARSHGFNHQDAEDLMQDTHVAAYQNLQQFSFRATYKTWISRIMINKCLYKLNHGYRKNERPGSDIISDTSQPAINKKKIMDPEQLAVHKEFNNVLEHALLKLPVQYRSVFLLREMEGMSVAETAELLSLSQVNVKVRMNRAKAMLQTALEQFYPSSKVFEFNLVYCDAIVQRVFDAIDNASSSSPG